MQYHQKIQIAAKNDNFHCEPNLPFLASFLMYQSIFFFLRGSLVQQSVNNRPCNSQSYSYRW